LAVSEFRAAIANLPPETAAGERAYQESALADALIELALRTRSAALLKEAGALLDKTTSEFPPAEYPHHHAVSLVRQARLGRAGQLLSVPIAERDRDAGLLLIRAEDLARHPRDSFVLRQVELERRLRAELVDGNR
jgi:hypothetical protein